MMLENWKSPCTIPIRASGMVARSFSLSSGARATVAGSSVGRSSRWSRRFISSLNGVGSPPHAARRGFQSTRCRAASVSTPARASWRISSRGIVGTSTSRNPSTNPATKYGRPKNSASSPYHMMGGTGTSVSASDSMMHAWRTTSAGPAIRVPSGATRSTSLPLMPPAVVRSSTKLYPKPAWPGSGEMSRTPAPESPVFARTSVVSCRTISSVEAAIGPWSGAARAAITLLSLHSGLRGSGMQAGFRARPRINPLEPCVHVFQRRIDFLSDAGAEVRRPVQDDIRGGGTFGGGPFLGLKLPIEPLEVVLDGRLHAGGALRNQAHPTLENGGAFREAKPVVKKLGDLEFDAPLPLARLGALFGGGSDQGGSGMLLLQVFPDRYGFAEALSVVEFKCGELPTGIAVGVRRAAVFGLHQVDLFGRDSDSLLQQEHPHGAWIWSE